MRLTLCTLLLFYSFHLFSQDSCPGMRQIYFYGDDRQLLDSSNKETRKYKINISMLDCNGDKVAWKSYRLSEGGMWGGYMNNAAVALFIQFIRGNDTMHVTLRKLFNDFLILNGIYFMKGKYEYSDFKPTDSLGAIVYMENWWNYNTVRDAAYPRPLYLKGTLTNYQHDPIAGGAIHVKKSTTATAADYLGNFRIDLNKDLSDKDSVILEFSAIGARTMQLIVHKHLLPIDNLIVALDNKHHGDLGIVVKRGFSFVTIDKRRNLKLLTSP